MNTAELSEALNFRLQQLEKSNNDQYQNLEQQERDDESRKLFEMAIRVYCHRIGGDSYSNAFEGGTAYRDKYDFEEKEEWLLDLSGRLMFSFDSLSDDISSIGGSADYSKFDWKVEIGPLGSEEEGIPCFTYLSSENNSRQRQWQHPYEHQHRIFMRDALQRYESSRPPSKLQSRGFDSSSIGPDSSGAESTLSNKLNREEAIFAQVLGVHIDEEHAAALVELAAELLNVLPADWEVGSVESDGGMLIPYFYDTVRRASQWNHPFETQHRQMIVARRNDLIQQKKEKRQRLDYTRALSTRVRERARQAELLVQEEMIARGQLLPEELRWRGDMVHEEKDDEEDDEDNDALEHKAEEPLEQQVVAAEPVVEVTKELEVEKEVVEVPLPEQSMSPLLGVTASLSLDEAMQPLPQLDEEHSVFMDEMSQAHSLEDDQSLYTTSEFTAAPSEEPPSASSLEKAAEVDAVVSPKAEEVVAKEEASPEPEPAAVVAPVVEEPEEAYADDFSVGTKDNAADNALKTAVSVHADDGKLVEPVKSSAVEIKGENESVGTYADDFSNDEQPPQQSVIVAVDSVHKPMEEPTSKPPDAKDEKSVHGEIIAVIDEIKHSTDEDSHGYEDDFSTSHADVEPHGSQPVIIEMKSQHDPLVKVEPVADFVSHSVHETPKDVEDEKLELKEPVQLEASSLEDDNASYDDDFSAVSNEPKDSSVEAAVVINVPEEVPTDAASGEEQITKKNDVETAKSTTVDAIKEFETPVAEPVQEIPVQEKLVQEEPVQDEHVTEPGPAEEEEKHSQAYEDDFSLVESQHSSAVDQTEVDAASAVESSTVEKEPLLVQSSTHEKEPLAMVASKEELVADSPMAEKEPSIVESSTAEEKAVKTEAIHETVPVPSAVCETIASDVSLTASQHEEELLVKHDDELRTITLSIRNIAVKSLKNVEIFGKNDPYVVLTWNNASWQMKTPAIDEGGSDAEWTFAENSHQFETNANVIEAGMLVVQAWDANRLRGDTFIGRGEASLSIRSDAVMRSLREGDGLGCEHLEVTLQIFDKKGKPSGVVIVMMDSKMEMPPEEAVPIEAAAVTEEVEPIPAVPEDDLKVSVEVDVPSSDDVEPSVAAEEESVDYGDGSFIEENSEALESQDFPIESNENNEVVEHVEVDKKPAVVNFVHQFVEDEESVAASVDSHPLWENLSASFADVARDRRSEEVETDFDVFAFDANSKVEKLHIESAVSAELEPQEEIEDLKAAELPVVVEQPTPQVEVVKTLVADDTPDVLITRSFPIPEDIPVKPLRPVDIASRPIKVTAKHMFLLNSRSAPNLPPPQEPSPVLKSSHIAPKASRSNGINWFTLGSYDSHAEALKGRQTMKSIVISDSNGTIQIDPRVNFHEINEDEVSKHHPMDLHERKEEDSHLMIIGRMNSNADRGIVKIVLRRDLSKLQWSVETDDREVKRIIQRHRRKRGIDGSNENIIPVKPLKRTLAQNAIGSALLSPTGPPGESLETKGFGELANMAVESSLKHKSMSKKVNIVKENIEKFRINSEKGNHVEVEVPSPPRPKVSDIDMRLLKIKRLLLMSSTVPVSSKASVHNVKLPPLN